MPVQNLLAGNHIFMDLDLAITFKNHAKLVVVVLNVWSRKFAWFFFSKREIYLISWYEPSRYTVAFQEIFPVFSHQACRLLSV
jgi:hypothetical protein